jgi:protein gp37
MKKTKIEWCDMTFNPVTGCIHDCPYCYARGIARRFDTFDKNPNLVISERKKWKRLENPTALIEVCEPIHWVCKGAEAVTPYPFGFTPTFHRYRLDAPQRVKKPSTVFVCGMADLFGDWVPAEWIREVMTACAASPRHRYLFLTKNPARYADSDWLPYNEDGEDVTALFGATATNEKQLKAATLYGAQWVSIEPLHEYLSAEEWLIRSDGTALFKWVVIGAEKGNRKNKITPEREWIDDIAKACNYTKTPIFMKDSLIPIVGAKNMRRELPWGLNE